MSQHHAFVTSKHAAARRIGAYGASLLLIAGLASCGSEVEGNSRETMSINTSATPTAPSTSTSSLVNVHRKKLKVVEDLGDGPAVTDPGKRLSRCAMPARPSQPSGKAVALFSTKQKTLLAKFVLSGQLDPRAVTRFVLTTKDGSATRIASVHNSLVVRNSVIVKGEGEQKLRGLFKMESHEDEVIVWLEIPREYVKKFDTKSWVATVQSDKTTLAVCRANAGFTPPSPTKRIQKSSQKRSDPRLPEQPKLPNPPENLPSLPVPPQPQR